MSTPEGRSLVNPGRRNEVTTPGVGCSPSLGTPEGRSGERSGMQGWPYLTTPLR